TAAAATGGEQPRRPERVIVVVRIPQLGLPRPNLLDLYIVRRYLSVFFLAFFSLIGIFYIATFIDHSDKVFKGTASWTTLLEYFRYATPQWFYYALPVAVLLATLVTIAVLTKNSELIVMKACGISLYRVAVPMLVGAVFAGAALVGLEQTVLGEANRRAEAIKHVMKGGSPETFDVLNRRWVMGTDGAIYHYNYFDYRTNRFSGLWVYRFSDDHTRLTERAFAAQATYEGNTTWLLQNGWKRKFDSGEPGLLTPFSNDRQTLESASYFTTQSPDERFMSYTQLRAYTDRLEASGLDVVKQQVALWRKVSFPFVTIIMTLLAVPFAVTIGRSGAMAGIAAAIAIAIMYWTTISVFAAMGAGGVIAPLLAAWAPNLLFGAGAAYLLLTVRT
ncbi:MAG TPA: LPS export ABC transporter permease LptG, partial [Vicinamibacterales bacterium]